MSDLSPESAGRAPGRDRLRARRILVVGAGQRAIDDPDPPMGNGRASCLLASREGASVTGADLDGESASRTLHLVERGAGRGLGVLGVPCHRPDEEPTIV